MADFSPVVLASDGMGWYELGTSSNDTLATAKLSVSTQLVAPSGGSFPVAPVAEELFWRSDEQKLYRRNTANTAWEAVKPDDEGVLESMGAVVNNPHGFPNRTDSDISFVDGTLTFTIAPSAAEFTFYYKGATVVKSASEDEVITNTDGLWFIYYDATLTLQSSQTPWNLLTHVPVATLYWNTTTTESTLGEERHGVIMDPVVHTYLHTTVGTRYRRGLDLSGYTLSTDTDAAVTVGVSDGQVYDEDILIDIEHAATPTNEFEQVLTDPAELPIFYRVGAAGVWTWDTPTDYWMKNTVAGRVNYNENTGATWQQTEAPNADYVAYWLIATNHVLNPIISVQGQRVDNTLNDARENNTYASLQFGTLPFQEFKVLYRLIIRTANGDGNTPKCTLEDVTDLRSLSSLVSGTFVPTSHSSLSDLTTSGHPAEIIVADTTNFGGILDSGDTDVQTALETIDDVRTVGSTAPTSPYDGQMWYDNSSGERVLYIYDSSRSKWLSSSEFALGWGHDSGDGELLRAYGVNNPGTGTGLRIPHDCTIVRITAQQRGGPAAKQVDILLDGTSTFNFDIASDSYKNNTADIDVDEDEELWLEIEPAGTASQDVTVILWLAWRGA